MATCRRGRRESNAADYGRPMTELIPTYHILDKNYPMQAAPLPDVVRSIAEPGTDVEVWGDLDPRSPHAVSGAASAPAGERRSLPG